MSVDTLTYKKLQEELKDTTLVAVSKFKSAEDIMALYELGHRDFGENFVQELLIKYEALPKDIRWHFIGHLQTNKVKFIVPFIYLIHGVDKLKLLMEIDKQGTKAGVKVNCLFQVHIAQEESKFGFDETELEVAIKQAGEHVKLKGLMGMASFTENQEKVKQEFDRLASIFRSLQHESNSFDILSMGMSGDYKIAMASGANMVRIGSLLFGSR